MLIVAPGSRVTGIAVNWNSCSFWFLFSSKPAVLVLPPEQGNKINKGWLAESEREDPACIEQSQPDTQKHSCLDYLCFVTVG